LLGYSKMYHQRWRNGSSSILYHYMREKKPEVSSYIKTCHKELTCVGWWAIYPFNYANELRHTQKLSQRLAVVTDRFRRLIRCRQYAWNNGQMAWYRVYTISRCAPELRRKYYEREVSDLHEGNPHNWWWIVKQITGSQSKSAQPLSELAHQLYDGDV
jgi:hypothetical protein